MAMVNMNLIGVFVTKLWPVQALACGGGGGDGGGDGGGATQTIISPKFSNFGDIIMNECDFMIYLVILLPMFNILGNIECSLPGEVLGVLAYATDR